MDPPPCPAVSVLVSSKGCGSVCVCLCGCVFGCALLGVVWGVFGSCWGVVGCVFGVVSLFNSWDTRREVV